MGKFINDATFIKLKSQVKGKDVKVTKDKTAEVEGAKRSINIKEDTTGTLNTVSAEESIFGSSDRWTVTDLKNDSVWNGYFAENGFTVSDDGNFARKYDGDKVIYQKVVTSKDGDVSLVTTTVDKTNNTSEREVEIGGKASELQAKLQDKSLETSDKVEAGRLPAQAQKDPVISPETSDKVEAGRLEANKTQGTENPQDANKALKGFFKWLTDQSTVGPKQYDTKDLTDRKIEYMG